MKKIIILCVLVMLGQSCKNVLDEEIVSGITANYYTTRAGLEDGVKASYEPLRLYYGTQLGYTLTVFGTDEYTKGADGDFKPVNDYIAAMNTPPASNYFRDIWNGFYRAINTTNTVVSRAPEIQMPEDVKAIRVAEAKFLRAHYYFILVQMFGPIHLTLEETTEVETTANRTPVLEIYQAIIADLEEAASTLPVKPADYGRASKPAAEHMLAKVHLTRATVEGNPNPTEDYQKAANYAKSVIENYDFMLLPSFASLFDQDNQQNSEVIWSVQYTSDPLTNGGGNSGHLYFLMEYDNGHKGTKRDIANGRPFKRFKPTQYTLHLFDLANDSRYNGSFKQVFYANNEATLDPVTGPVRLGDTAIYLPPVELPADVVAAKKYKVINPSQVASDGNYRYFPSLLKFLDPRRISIQDERGSRDFVVARLADTYLIAAEANLKLGNMTEAVDYINAVRRRAAFPGSETAMEISAEQLDMNFILDERARELLGEMQRWFDLKRTGTLVDRVKMYNPDGGPNIQPYHVLRPIPSDQLDRVTNKEDFQQNPGY